MNVGKTWVSKIQRVLLFIPYNRKLSREKIFTSFTVLEPPVKVFSMEFGCAYPPIYDRLQHSTKVCFFFLQRNGHFLPICESFLLQKFPTIWLLYSALSDCNIDHLNIKRKLFEVTFSILNDLLTAGHYITVIQKQEQIPDKSHVTSDTTLKSWEWAWPQVDEATNTCIAVT